MPSLMVRESFSNLNTGQAGRLEVLARVDAAGGDGRLSRGRVPFFLDLSFLSRA
jgi:hypothetical protein